MSTPEIDYYGPAEQGRYTAKQTESALDCMVLQPLDDYGTYNDGGNESYVEIWKGPVTAMTNVTNGFNVMGVIFRVGAERPIIQGGRWVRRFDPPALPQGWFWMVDEITVEECKPAGDHAFLRVKYVARNSEWSARSADGGGRMDQSKEKWSLEWQSRSATPLIYLARKFGKLRFVKWVNPSVKKEGEDWELDEDKDPDMAVFAKMAIDAAQAQKADSRIRLGKYQFVWKDIVYELPETCTPTERNVNPREVVDKFIKGVNPLLHYPVLKKVTAANFKRSEWNTFPKWDSAIGEKGQPIARFIDMEVDFPEDCPFDFDSDDPYRWIKVSDNFETDMVTRGQLTYTRTEIWWGDLWWDPQYYSALRSTRWVIGDGE